MTLIKWNPLRDVTRWHPVTDFPSEVINMQREVDRMFDRFRGGIADENGASTWLPAVDILENANDYVLKFELPGVEKNDVKITLQNDVLTLRGEKRQENEKKGDNFHRMERSFGVFQRSFTLASSVNSETIEATYDNGILTITLPKVEEAKPKEIEVKVK